MSFCDKLSEFSFDNYLEINISFPMPRKDIFDKPFDEGTIAKLKIFEDYFKEWLPVFITKKEPIWNEIQIFDLFAGEGKDFMEHMVAPLELFQY